MDSLERAVVHYATWAEAVHSGQSHDDALKLANDKVREIRAADDNKARRGRRGNGRYELPETLA
jgi:hypothetical protein